MRSLVRSQMALLCQAFATCFAGLGGCPAPAATLPQGPRALAGGGGSGLGQMASAGARLLPLLPACAALLPRSRNTRRDGGRARVRAAAVLLLLLLSPLWMQHSLSAWGRASQGPCMSRVGRGRLPSGRHHGRRPLPGAADDAAMSCIGRSDSRRRRPNCPMACTHARMHPPCMCMCMHPPHAGPAPPSIDCSP